MKEEDISRTRVTSDDCVLPEMSGKYELVFFVAQRARVLSGGGSPMLVTGFDKPQNHSILVALEEIRQNKISYQDMIESLASPRSEAASHPLNSPDQTSSMLPIRNQSPHDGSLGSENFVSTEESDLEDEEEDILIDYKAQEEYED